MSKRAAKPEAVTPPVLTLAGRIQDELTSRIRCIIADYPPQRFGGHDDVRLAIGIALDQLQRRLATLEADTGARRD